MYRNPKNRLMTNPFYGNTRHVLTNHEVEHPEVQSEIPSKKTDFSWLDLYILIKMGKTGYMY